MEGWKGEGGKGRVEGWKGEGGGSGVGREGGGDSFCCASNRMPPELFPASHIQMSYAS